MATRNNGNGGETPPDLAPANSTGTDSENEETPNSSPRSTRNDNTDSLNTTPSEVLKLLDDAHARVDVRRDKPPSPNKTSYAGKIGQEAKRGFRDAGDSVAAGMAELSVQSRLACERVGKYGTEKVCASIQCSTQTLNTGAKTAAKYATDKTSDVLRSTRSEIKSVFGEYSILFIIGVIACKITDRFFDSASRMSGEEYHLPFVPDSQSTNVLFGLTCAAWFIVIKKAQALSKESRDEWEVHKKRSKVEPSAIQQYARAEMAAVKQDQEEFVKFMKGFAAQQKKDHDELMAAQATGHSAIIKRLEALEQKNEEQNI